MGAVSADSRMVGRGGAIRVVGGGTAVSAIRHSLDEINPKSSCVSR